MASEHVGKTVTLEVVPPKNAGQRPVGFWRVSKKVSYTVFLPSSAQPGTNVRVVLHDTGNFDRRTMELFEGKPAPEEFTEKWFDNGDGTARRVRVGIDWKFTEREAETLETRKLEQKESSPSTSTKLQVVWNTDLVTTKIEEYQISTYPLNQEKVESSQLVWRQISTRTTQTTPVQYPVTHMGDINQQIAIMGLQKLVWDDGWPCRLDFTYIKDAQDKVYSVNLKWGELLPWVQSVLQADWPVCTCGRQRVDAPTNGYKDHYPKCGLCRKKERCQVCSKRGDVIQQIDGRLICFECQEAEKQEAFINLHLSAAQRKELADFAHKLRAGQALEKEVAMVVLGATLEHIASEQKRTQLLEKWKVSNANYYWYYFTPEGVYGTKLAPTALQLIEFLPEATGPGFVEMVAWLTGEPMSMRGDDYYWQTQVQKTELHPGHRMTALQLLTTGSPQVAIRLRGSEDDRIAAAIGYGELVKMFGQDADQVKEVAAILQAEAQDYAAALARSKELIWQATERQKLIDAGELWPDVEIQTSVESRTSTKPFAIAADGTIIDPMEQSRGFKSRVDAFRYGDLPATVLVISHEDDNYGYRYSERWTVHLLPKQVTQEQITTVRRLEEETRVYFQGAGTGWNLRTNGDVKFSTAYHRDFAGVEKDLDNEMRNNLPIDVTKWVNEVDVNEVTVVGPYRKVDKFAKKIHEAETAVAELQQDLQRLQAERVRAEAANDEAEMEFLIREESSKGDQPVAVGTVFEVPGFLLRTERNEVRLEYGPHWDNASNSIVYLVLDPWAKSSARVQPKQRTLVRVRAKSGAQLHLFRDWRRDSQNKKQMCVGYYVIAIVSPQDFDLLIADTQKKLDAAQEEMRQLLTKRNAADRQKIVATQQLDARRTIAREPAVALTFGEGDDESPIAAALRRAMERK